MMFTPLSKKGRGAKSSGTDLFRAESPDSELKKNIAMGILSSATSRRNSTAFDKAPVAGRQVTQQAKMAAIIKDAMDNTKWTSSSSDEETDPSTASRSKQKMLQASSKARSTRGMPVISKIDANFKEIKRELAKRMKKKVIEESIQEL